MDVSVHEAGKDQLAARADRAVGAKRAGHLAGLADGDDPVVLDGHRAVADDPALAVHRHEPVRRVHEEGRHAEARSQSGMQAVTVISTRNSGAFSITSTVVLAGLSVGKYLAYSSL